jgi:Domain of unknown function (DUF4410)
MLNTAKNNAKKVAVLVLVLWGLWIPLLQAQEKPAIVVQPFTTANGVSWPYDMERMTSQTLAELQTKDGKKYEISNAAPLSRAHYYSLGGEVLAWHPGNRAKRVLVGVGTGRETAKIHYWLADETGKKVFEHEDTIRAEFWGNAYADSVGQLAHPFADKIAGRLAEAKLN